MENHPIPQDVTGFQFKLIGNMTIKQFVYLATGIVLAWVFLQLPISFLIKIPLCSFFAFFGIGLAYLPVSGRPMDVMIGNFIKALFRPTQFVYKKSGVPLYFPNKSSAFPHGVLDSRGKSNLHNPQSLPRGFEKALDKSAPAPSQNDKLEPYHEPNDLTFAPSPLLVKTEVKNIQLPRIVGRNIGTPSVPDSPNLITGITKDPRGNALSNILIEVKDKENNPVRAFKTNEFGRFASATPLINGTYTMEFEDPKGQNKFEAKTINTTGQIILPIVTTSIDTREELRRSLFQQGNSI